MRRGTRWDLMHSGLPNSPKRPVARRNGARRLALPTLAATFALGATSALWTTAARADEPIKASEPSLMAEPGEIVDVVDAFDDKNKDPFDLHLSLGFVQTWESSKIKRESNVGPDGKESDAGFTHNIENIASYKHSTSVLNMRADVGLFRDLGLFFRVPFVLADDRSLDDLDGSATGVNERFGRASDTATGDPFFKLPFKAPTRSGVDYVAAGLRYSIFNQTRDPTKPTWTLELEGRFGVGEPLHACNASPDTISDAAYRAAGLSKPAGGNGAYTQCNTPGASVYDDTTNRWYRDPRDGGRSPGISRGTNAVKFGMMVSERYRYVEPYGGFWFMAEFQKRGTDMGDFAGIQGVITNHPPLQGGFIAGLMIHPWENRESFQRFSIDLKFRGTYVSQGRDYTELFDALGTSGASSLVAPNPTAYHTLVDGSGKPVLDKNGQNQSVGDYGHTINFTGVTDVEAHGIFGGSMGFVIQAGEFIKFHAGLGLTYVQSHLISSSDACNPDFQPSPGDAGRCQNVRSSTSATGGATSTATVTGAPNPNHRANLDLPGRRFRVSETFLWDAWLTGTVMF